MNDEHELTRRLQLVAQQVDAAPDLGQVQLLADRRRTRRRNLGLVAAGVLIAGAAGVGFGVGVSVGEDEERIAEADQAVDTTVAPSPTTAPPGTVAPTPSSAPSDAPTATDVDAGDTQPTVPPFVDTTGMFGPSSYQLVSDRTTSEGVRVRVQLGPKDLVLGGATGGPCAPVRDVRVALVAGNVVDVTTLIEYADFPGEAAISTIPAGFTDGVLLAVVAVQVGDGVTEVRARSGGSQDVAPVIDGLAVLVLASQSVAETFVHGSLDDDLTVALVDAQGAHDVDVVASVATSQSEVWSDYCAPRLPAPGEQPADPAAAEAEIRERYAILRDFSIPNSEKPDDLLIDNTGVTAAREAIEAGPNGDLARAATSTIEELVFTSPTEAWFRYRLDTAAGTFDNRFGRVELVDGTWRFDRAVPCQDLSLGGSGCNPPVNDLVPPS